MLPTETGMVGKGNGQPVVTETRSWLVVSFDPHYTIHSATGWRQEIAAGNREPQTTLALFLRPVVGQGTLLPL